MHKQNFLEFADALLDEKKADPASDRYTIGAMRVQFAEKDPRGWREFAEQFKGLSRTNAILDHSFAGACSV